MDELGGIDFMLVGIGMNGHIGFNEPGVSPDLQSHVIALDEMTRAVGQKYFHQETALSQGITLGLKNLLESGKVLLVANGERKAPIVRLALEGPISNEVPASLIRKHPKGLAFLDQKAAQLISGFP